MLQISFLAVIKIAQRCFKGKPLVCSGAAGTTIFIYTENHRQSIIYDVIQKKIIGGNHSLDDLIMQILLKREEEKQKNLFSEIQYTSEKGDAEEKRLLEFKP